MKYPLPILKALSGGKSKKKKKKCCKKYKEGKRCKDCPKA